MCILSFFFRIRFTPRQRRFGRSPFCFRCRRAFRLWEEPREINFLGQRGWVNDVCFAVCRFQLMTSAVSKQFSAVDATVVIGSWKQIFYHASHANLFLLVRMAQDCHMICLLVHCFLLVWIMQVPLEQSPSRPLSCIPRNIFEKRDPSSGEDPTTMAATQKPTGTVARRASVANEGSFIQWKPVRNSRLRGV